MIFCLASGSYMQRTAAGLLIIFYWEEGKGVVDGIRVFAYHSVKPTPTHSDIRHNVLTFPNISERKTDLREPRHVYI